MKPPRGPGRPREFDGTPVSVRLPKHLHDDLSREAIREDRKLSEVIRERLDRHFVSQKGAMESNG